MIRKSCLFNQVMTVETSKESLCLAWTSRPQVTIWTLLPHLSQQNPSSSTVASTQSRTKLSTATVSRLEILHSLIWNWSAKKRWTTRSQVCVLSNRKGKTKCLCFMKIIGCKFLMISSSREKWAYLSGKMIRSFKSRMSWCSLILYWWCKTPALEFSSWQVMLLPLQIKAVWWTLQLRMSDSI